MANTTDGPTDGGVLSGVVVLGQELRRRNVSALVVDVLYVFTTAFLATLAVHGFWPAVIATLPLVTFLYFAWHATKIFFVVNLVAIVAAVAATEAGVSPI